MLAFYPELVDMSLAEEGFAGDFTAVRGKKIIGRMTKAFADIVYKKTNDCVS